MSSINKHFYELVTYKRSLRKSLYIIILTETWLLTYFNFTKNGFVGFKSTGTCNKSNGVNILLKKNKF